MKNHAPTIINKYVASLLLNKVLAIYIGVNRNSKKQHIFVIRKIWETPKNCLNNLLYVLQSFIACLYCCWVLMRYLTIYR